MALADGRDSLPALLPRCRNSPPCLGLPRSCSRTFSPGSRCSHFIFSCSAQMTSTDANKPALLPPDRSVRCNAQRDICCAADVAGRSPPALARRAQRAAAAASWQRRDCGCSRCSAGVCRQCDRYQAADLDAGRVCALARTHAAGWHRPEISRRALPARNASCSAPTKTNCRATPTNGSGAARCSTSSDASPALMRRWSALPWRASPNIRCFRSRRPLSQRL